MTVGKTARISVSRRGNLNTVVSARLPCHYRAVISPLAVELMADEVAGRGR